MAAGVERGRRGRDGSSCRPIVAWNRGGPNRMSWAAHALYAANDRWRAQPGLGHRQRGRGSERCDLARSAGRSRGPPERTPAFGLGPIARVARCLPWIALSFAERSYAMGGRADGGPADTRRVGITVGRTDAARTRASACRTCVATSAPTST